MFTKILWALIGLNTIALVIFIIAFLASTDGRNVDTMEKGWTFILFGAGLVIILLAAVPLRFSQSTLSLSVSTFFAALPLVVGLGVLVANKLPSFKKKQTLAEVYFKDETQQNIASAIEKGDTALVRELIKGKDLNIQGNRVWDADGINYLQFAIRFRARPDSTFNEDANNEIIRTLVAQGSPTTRALAEGIDGLPVEMISLLLDAGADPNTYGAVNSDPLLFSAIRSSKRENDIAILLIKKGAKVDIKNSDKVTPLMFAANNAGTSENWVETWRFVRYLLEKAHADYKYTRFDGINFSRTIHAIQVKAKEENIVMSPDFIAVVKWLENQEAKDEKVQKP